MESPLRMAPSPRHRGVRRITGPADSAGERVDSSDGNIGSTHELSSVRPVTFSFAYTNIRGLYSNFSSVEHHLSSTLPNILFLSETQLSKNASTDPFLISQYNLYPSFRSKGGVCA